MAAVIYEEAHKHCLLFLTQVQERAAFLSQGEPAAGAWEVMQDPIRIQVTSYFGPQDPCSPH